MKKLMFFIAMMCSISFLSATNLNNESYNQGRPGYHYQIPVEQLPKPIIKHLEKKYKDYEIIISKRKNNGNYFIKIQYDGNG